MRFDCLPSTHTQHTTPAPDSLCSLSESSRPCPIMKLSPEEGEMPISVEWLCTASEAQAGKQGCDGTGVLSAFFFPLLLQLQAFSLCITNKGLELGILSSTSFPGKWETWALRTETSWSWTFQCSCLNASSWIILMVFLKPRNSTGVLMPSQNGEFIKRET